MANLVDPAPSLQFHQGVVTQGRLTVRWLSDDCHTVNFDCHTVFNDCQHCNLGAALEYALCFDDCHTVIWSAHTVITVWGDQFTV